MSVNPKPPGAYAPLPACSSLWDGIEMPHVMTEILLHMQRATFVLEGVRTDGVKLGVHTGPQNLSMTDLHRI